MSELDTLEPVTVERDGRIFSGVGVTAGDLNETIDAHEDTNPDPSASKTAPASPTAAAEPTGIPSNGESTEPGSQERNADGTFKKPSKGRQRFDELTAQREAETRRADALQAELAAERAARVVPTVDRAVASSLSTPGPTATTRPKPLVDQVGSVYPTYEDFLGDLAHWTAEEVFAKSQADFDFDARVQKAMEADRAKREVVTRLDRIRTLGKDAYPDFEQAVASIQDIHFPIELLRAMIEHPQSEHLHYALAKDRAKATEIAAMRDPVRQALAVADLVRTTALASPASSAPTGGTTSAAPAPYQPVGTSSKTTVPPLADLAASGDDYDKSGYRERRAAERKAFRR